MRTGREIHLAAVLQGEPAERHFAVVEVPVPAPGPGEVLVRNAYMVLSPAVLSRMAAAGGLPVTRYEVGKVLFGSALGEVLATGDEAPHGHPAAGTDGRPADAPDGHRGRGPDAPLRPGDVVVHELGWREYALAPPARFRRVPRRALAAPARYLGNGLLAYYGLLDIAGMRPGDTVYVSSAAGAVGSVAGQIARLKGAARVIGSAGTAAKTAHLTEVLGFDAAFDHRASGLHDPRRVPRHAAQLAARLRAAAPGGIDVYFDTVGGAHLEAAVEVLRPHGRVALCGMLAEQHGTGRYAAEPTPGPRNLGLAVAKSLTLRGFRVQDCPASTAARYEADLEEWLARGAIRLEDTVVDGLESAPAALRDLVRGTYLGRVLVRLTDPGSHSGTTTDPTPGTGPATTPGTGPGTTPGTDLGES
ncbi:zinc-binding dehydrogenase [Streptomyces sp. NPDC002073]